MVLLHSIDLPMGEFEAPEFTLSGTDGKDYSLKDIKGEKGTLIFFTCNHCPYAKASWPLMIELAEEYQEKGIGFVAINPNDSETYPEDSLENMKDRSNEWGVNFPYLRDKSQNVAKNYQAQCTPDIYVFDSGNKLFYHGRINDNWQNPEEATSEDLKDALNRLLDEKSPPKDQSPSMGCSIKWKK